MTASILASAALAPAVEAQIFEQQLNASDAEDTDVFGWSIDIDGDLMAVGAAAKAVEARGFTGITTRENRHNPFLPLAVAATHTTSLELRTSVAIAFARSPMASANMAWDIQKASNGRFTLGIGSQVKGHNVRRFSVPWSAPAPRMREYVQALRAIWDCWQNGTKLAYEGEHYQADNRT